MAQQKRAEETRENIVKAAVEAFSQRGYEATGVAEICDAAGISKGAFYHHFPSKQNLYLWLMDSWLDSIDVQLTRIKDGAESVPRALNQMGALFTEIFSSADKQIPIFLEFLTTAARDPEVWRAAIEPYRRYRSYFSEMLALGMDEGSVRSCDPETMSQLLVSLSVGLILQGVLDPTAGDWGDIARDAISLFIRDFVEAN